MKVKLQYQTGSTLPGLKNGQNFPEIFISQVMLIACDRNYFINNHNNKDIVNQQQQQQPNSSIINNDHDHDDQQHFQTQESNRHHSSIQYKLKYKLTFLIDGNYSEHVSQLLWWS